MLRITVNEGLESIALLIEGKLAGAWVEELRAVWSQLQSRERKANVVVSLSGVLSVDAAGLGLLSEIQLAGGVLTGSGLLAKTLIENITEI